MALLDDLKNEITQLTDKERGAFLQRFFKTGKGDYAEGDIFAGLSVPQSRLLAKKYKDLSLADVKKLLTSPIHEERLIALFILVIQFANGTEEEKKVIYELYLSHTAYINNWDLVDSSADKIVGEYLLDKEMRILKKLAKSNSLWERRIAIIATYAYIKQGKCDETFQIAEILMHDKHDLIHKAVGWMLREVGKRCAENVLETFLKKQYLTMPRTMLRYAIERFSEEKRKAYLSGNVV